MIFKGRINNLVFSFTCPQKPKGIIIICDGLPGNAERKVLLNIISKKRYMAIHPKYSGTWESGGIFLNESPVKDIKNIINFIQKNKYIKELYSNKIFINILGSSFGGSVALCLAKDKNVKKIVALSPVVNFKKHNTQYKEQDLQWLMKFIKLAFNRAYRFKNKNWDKMIKGKLFNPPLTLDNNNKVLIGYGEQDKTVNHRSIKKYIDKNKIKYFYSKNKGHLSFSKINKNMWKIIMNWFN